MFAGTPPAKRAFQPAFTKDGRSGKYDTNAPFAVDQNESLDVGQLPAAMLTSSDVLPPP